MSLANKNAYFVNFTALTTPPETTDGCIIWAAAAEMNITSIKALINTATNKTVTTVNDMKLLTKDNF